MRLIKKVLSDTETVKRFIRLSGEGKTAERFFSKLKSMGAEVYPFNSFRTMKVDHGVFHDLVREYLLRNGVKDKDGQFWLLPEQVKKFNQEREKWYQCYDKLYEFLYSLWDEDLISYEDLHDDSIILSKIVHNPNFMGFPEELLGDMVSIVLKDMREEIYTHEEFYDV